MNKGISVEISQLLKRKPYFLIADFRLLHGVQIDTNIADFGGCLTGAYLQIIFPQDGLECTKNMEPAGGGKFVGETSASFATVEKRFRHFCAQF